MSDDIVARLRAVLHEDRSVELMNTEASDEIERLRKERETYRTCYLKCLASTVWMPNTHWRTYRNPQREDGLFVATVGDLVRSYQAIPDGALSIRYGLPHDEANEVVEILNEWTASDAAREKP